jgi:hypothetical protein
MRSPLRAALAAALLLLSAAPLEAQRTSLRRGMWVGGGIGIGSARLSCEICRSSRDGGTSGYLRAGMTVNRSILVGLEGIVWYKTANSIDQLLGSLQAVVLLYPKPASGFYLKTGLGIAQYSAKDNTDKVSSQALAGQIGIGYEVPMGRGLSIVPFANFLGSTGGDVRFNDTVSGLSANSSLIQFGVGVTLH